jgi:hypothetical protein
MMIYLLTFLLVICYMLGCDGDFSSSSFLFIHLVAHDLTDL